MAFGRRQIVVSGCVAMCLYIWGVPSLIPLSLIHQQRYWPNLRGSLDHGGNRQQILVPEKLLVLLVEKLSCFTGCSVILCTRHCDVIMSHWILSCVAKCWMIQLCVHWGLYDVIMFHQVRNDVSVSVDAPWCHSVALDDLTCFTWWPIASFSTI